MTFDVLIPARMASTRLPGKALAEIGGLPMVVRVAQRAAASEARQVVVATDHADILAACAAHGVVAVATRADHPSGSDRLAEACAALGLGGDDMVVNVQGDEPLIDPALIDACAGLLAERTDCVMATVAHPITSRDDLDDPNIVKVVIDRASRALYFSRAPIPHRRDAPTDAAGAASPPGLRHVGLYAYRAGFLRSYPTLEPAPLENIESLEQLRALWHGHRIAVHVSAGAAGIGIDTAEDLARVRALFARSTSGST